MVQQIVGGEDFVRVECDAVGDAIEPEPGELTPGGPEPFGEDTGERTILLYVGCVRRGSLLVGVQLNAPAAT